MSTVTENDLREVKELITNLSKGMNEGFTQVNDRFNNLEEKIISLDKTVGKIETRLEDWKPSIDKTADLSEKIGELKNWRQIGIVLFTGLITSLFWIFKDRI